MYCWFGSDVRWLSDGWCGAGMVNGVSCCMLVVGYAVVYGVWCVVVVCVVGMVVYGVVVVVEW